MPPPIPGVLRVTSMNILGVTFSDSLSVSNHIDTVVSKCSQNMYALKILRAHGLSGPSLHMVCRSMLDNRISYAAPFWSGFASAEDLSRLRAVLARVRRWGFDGGPSSIPL